MPYKETIKQGLVYSSLFVFVSLLLSLGYVVIFPHVLSINFYFVVVALCLTHFLISGPFAIYIETKVKSSISTCNN
ncbi:hypothetical protein [Amphibacillus indicireducens]